MQSIVSVYNPTKRTDMQNEKIHKRGRYAAEFKEKVAWEALTGAKTHAQITLATANAHAI